MTSTYLSSQTADDFFKARNKALFNTIQHILNPDEATLISFSDVKKLLKPKNEVYKGMQVIPINLIVGSEGRYQDFDNHFFPKSNFLKSRWEHVDMAHYQDVNLPPISVYELGGLYFVRDGNHRVSVAKAQGIEFIDAEVVSLQSEIKLKAGSTKEQMIRQVIEYEKRLFYAETNFGDITDYWVLDFSRPGQYDVIYNHILIHKYYINMDKKDEIPMEDAIMSWFQKVYMPIINAIASYTRLKSFKNLKVGDLYIFFTKYWDELKQKYGNEYSIEEAAHTFKKKYSTNLITRIKNHFQKRKMQKNLQK